jgi:DNA (cytosine-5)-methyltransferase 1
MPSSLIHPRYSTDMKAVDIFAGCGGLSLGLAQAGIEVTLAVDNWKPSIEVYSLNFDHEAINQDLSKVEESVELISSYEFEILAGGPPCQDFSSAGKRDLNGGRADLTYSYADIVSRLLPKFFIMENVEQIRKSHILPEVLNQLADSGYGMTAVILDASYCGAPQARKRFFLIGHLGSPHNFLMGNLVNQLSSKPMTMRDYFGDSLGTDYYYRHPRNYNRRGVYALDEPSATIRGVNRPIPPGYQLHPNDPAGISLSDVRPLTTEERAQVQTFPADFKWLGGKTDREQMIGNAVPVALGRFIGEAVQNFTKNGSINLVETLPLDLDDFVLLPQRSLDHGIESMVPYQIEPIKDKNSRKKKSA